MTSVPNIRTFSFSSLSPKRIGRRPGTAAFDHHGRVAGILARSRQAPPGTTAKRKVTIQVGTARRAVRAASSGATDRPPDASARRPYLNSYVLSLVAVIQLRVDGNKNGCFLNGCHAKRMKSVTGDVGQNSSFGRGVPPERPDASARRPYHVYEEFCLTPGNGSVSDG